MPLQQEIWMMPNMFVASPKVDAPYCSHVVLDCEEGEVCDVTKVCT
jgi:hypothetical protein